VSLISLALQVVDFIELARDIPRDIPRDMGVRDTRDTRDTRDILEKTMSLNVSIKNYYIKTYFLKYIIRVLLLGEKNLFFGTKPKWREKWIYKSLQRRRSLNGADNRNVFTSLLLVRCWNTIAGPFLEGMVEPISFLSDSFRPTGMQMDS
jgi:hypothetical protein